MNNTICFCAFCAMIVLVECVNPHWREETPVKPETEQWGPWSEPFDPALSSAILYEGTQFRTNRDGVIQMRMTR